MSGIRGKNTRGEILLRRGLHARGFRFRINARHLPGTPDVVLPRYRTVMFFNGCFWHQHDCSLFRWPKTREEFWREKLGRNRERDERIARQLIEDGWRVGILWECGLKAAGKNPSALLDDIGTWIRTGAPTREWAAADRTGPDEQSVPGKTGARAPGTRS